MSPLVPWPTVLVAFARIGATSFGGGSATIAALRQLCLRRGWMDEARFLDILVLSKLTPGISILAQALLIGRSVAGVPGMVAGTVGLMAPSVLITVGIAWAYERAARLPGTGGLLHALSGVAGGFAVAMVLLFLRDLTRGRAVTRTLGAFLGFLGLAWWLDNPLLVMGLAILAGLLAPALFEDARPAGTPATDDAEPAADDAEPDGAEPDGAGPTTSRAEAPAPMTLPR